MSASDEHPAATASPPLTIQGVLRGLPPGEIGALRAKVECQLALAKDEVARLEFEIAQIDEAMNCVS